MRAEVDIELNESDNGWAPYLSLGDARKLDAVREALRRGDIQGASRSPRGSKRSSLSRRITFVPSLFSDGPGAKR